jgi:hypothetical protein
MASADLPLATQWATASRLKTASNLRRGFKGFFQGLCFFHQHPHGLPLFTVRKFEATSMDVSCTGENI